jgi:hypothetical protein
MHIDSYSFGTMTVDGKAYDSDLIIFPDRIMSGWWRREGHSLAISDLDEVLRYKPDILVVGTGASGIMDVPDPTRRMLRENNIELMENKTSQACKIFNQKIKEGRKVAGAFHLTC